MGVETSLDSPIIAVTVQSHSKRGEGQIIVSPLNPGERRKKSLRIFGILLGCALFSIFLPGLHFILVPGFFLSSFFVSYLTYRTKEEWKSAFSCPECGTTPLQQIILKRKFPLIVTCSSCGVNLWLRKAIPSPQVTSFDPK